MLLRAFVNCYEMDIMDEHAFLQWKEDVNDTYPGKGKALFQVKTFLLVQFYRVYQKFRLLFLVHFFQVSDILCDSIEIWLEPKMYTSNEVVSLKIPGTDHTNL